MAHDLVSVVIVNWNGKRWLSRCLTSLQKQTYHALEIILVDNASSDGSTQYVAKNFPTVKIIKNSQNLGFATANNKGIAASKGKYIMLLNNDTWLLPDAISKLLNHLISNKLDVVSPQEAKYDGTVEVVLTSTIDRLGHAVFLNSKHSSAHPFFLRGVCLLFSKQLYIDTGGLDNSFFMYSEEVDWFWRLSLYKKKFDYAPDIYVYHYAAGSTGGLKIKSSTFLWRNQNTLQMLLKNYSFENLIWVIPAYFIQNIFEIILFLVIGRPDLSWTYILGWKFNIANIAGILQKRKEIQHHREVSDDQITKLMYPGSGKLRELIHKIIPSKNRRILDMGCGSGYHAKLLSSKGIVTGIDLSVKNIQLAKKRYPGIEFKAMSAEKMKFKDNQFDEIDAWDVLEHVDDLDATVSEMCRVVKKNGSLIVNVPAEKSEHWLLKIRPSYFKEIHHVRIFSGNDLETLFKKQGFVAAKKEPRGFLQHIELYYMFTRKDKTGSQLSINDWRASPTAMFIHVFMAFFDPYYLQTPLIYIPLWIITMPLGYLVNFVGNKYFPKSMYYEFKSV